VKDRIVHGLIETFFATVAAVIAIMFVILMLLVASVFSGIMGV